MKILVCDDDHMIREVAAVMLRMGNHQVELSFDGQDALEKIQSNPDAFELLITDFKMPRLSGDELIEKVRAMEIPLKVILITGHADELEDGRLERLQVDGFLKKPFKMPALLDCVKNPKRPAGKGRKADPVKWYSRKAPKKS